MHTPDRAISRAFDNQYRPALYFVDARRWVRHRRFGEGAYDRSEIVVQLLPQGDSASGIDGGLAVI